MERHVLVVFPHPDDETFSSAGTIHSHVLAGTPVTYVCGTLGEMGRNMGKPFFATRETLPKVREKELREACRIMGVTDLRLLGLRDKTLEFEDPELLADKIEAVVREVNPSLVITFYPGYAVHPDHEAMAVATVIALKRIPKESRPMLHCLPITRDREQTLGAPDILNDISSVQAVKMEAIRAHRSQSEAMLLRMESRMKEDPAYAEQLRRERQFERYWVYKFND